MKNCGEKKSLSISKWVGKVLEKSNSTDNLRGNIFMVKIQGQDLKFKCGYRKADLADGVGGAALEKI